MNNYLMFDRLLKCSVVPKVGTGALGLFTQELCGNLYVDAGENQQGDIQGESERAKASWKDGHVSFLAFDREKTSV